MTYSTKLLFATVGLLALLAAFVVYRFYDWKHADSPTESWGDMRPLNEEREVIEVDDLTSINKDTSQKVMEYEKGTYHLTDISLVDKEIHLHKGVNLFLHNYTTINNSKIRIDEDAQIIVRSPLVVIMNNMITGSSTNPIIPTYFTNRELPKAILSWSRLEHFNQLYIDHFDWEANVVTSWGFVEIEPDMLTPSAHGTATDPTAPDTKL